MHGPRIFPCLVNPYGVLDYQSTYLGAVHFAYSPPYHTIVTGAYPTYLSKPKLLVKFSETLFALELSINVMKHTLHLLEVISLQLMSSLDRFKSKISMKKMLEE